MTPGQLSAKVIAERAAWIRRMVASLRTLPGASFETFQSDSRNIAAAESYLRRALEALLDLGRHVLAKGFGQAVSEYKDVANVLAQVGVLDAQHGALLRELAGYRNRLVHFYHEVSDLELYEICTARLGDLESLLEAMLRWINAHPERLDREL
ncbi:MAG: DUF86 domain-containing protein [candidate division NC10 bacterium]|nr:DUF86 domain-containing protein [candidate division NC10 bacterium]MDE2321376.1 DUF86 domain-containing protein [candidate division NC10 bacterium]